MTTNLDHLNLYTSGFSTPVNQQSSEARHGGWLLELERAMLAIGTKKNTAEGSTPDHAGLKKSQELDSSSSNFVMQHSQTLLRSDDRRMVDQSVVSRANNDLKSASATSASAMVSSGKQDFAQASQDTDTSGADKALLPLQQLMSNSMPNEMLKSGVPRAISMTPALSPSYAGSPLRTVMGYSALSGVDGAGQSGGVVPSEAKQLGNITLFQRTGTQQAELGNEPAAEEVGGRKSGEGDVEAKENSENFARRQMHTYTDENGVQTWIRDATLTESQARKLAYSLNTELNDAGVRLASLTLNGKKISHSSLVNPSEKNEEAYSDREVVQHPDSPHSSTQSQQKFLGVI